MSKDQIRHPEREFAASNAIDQVNAMLYALSDPHQKVSSLSVFGDEIFKAVFKRFRALGTVEFDKQTTVQPQRNYTFSAT